MAIAAGTRFGPHEIVESLGSGGMGDVYRARDTQLMRDVAIKVLSQSFVNDANRIARLQREAEVLASLNHLNIAHIYGLERGEGTTGLVMELVEGPTLAMRIAQGALPAAEALDVALQIAAALEAAHERGIVHRDLKPSNVKLKPDGTVKVLDFGIAKALELQATSGSQALALTTPAMTQLGVVLGTAAYMSPEQARGKPVDRRADIWAFGCVLYEMLAGQPAFVGEDVTTTLARVLERDPDMSVLPKNVAPNIRHAIELCLQKDVKKRIADIHDVRLLLEGRFESRSQPAQAANVAAPIWRRPLPVSAALLGAAIIASAYMWRPTPATTSPATPLPVTRFVVTPPAEAPLTNLGGYDVVISPDGERLAYYAQDPQTGSVSLHVRELDGLEARRIPGTEIAQPPVGGNMNPFFSPDGRSIGFRSPDRGIIRVAIDGAPPLEIMDDQPVFLGAAWTRDDTLIYSSGTRLQRVSAGGGGTPEPLTPEVEGGVVVAPVLLPGERAVLFGTMQGQTERVSVLDLATREQKVLIEGAANPMYAPTGHVVFVRGTTLMVARFNLAELTVTGEPVALLQGVRHNNVNVAADYALSPTGTLVYVPGREENVTGAAVVWVDRNGRAGERALNELVANPRNPKLSTDGGRLVLTTGQIPDGDVWTYDLGGRPPIPLAVVGNNRNAVWSPDGVQVAFAGGAAGMPPDVYVTRADGSVLDPQPLRPDGLVGVPAVWSSAGELFLTRARNGVPDIVATPAVPAGEVRDVVVTDDAEFDPALSPDGRWLAYASNRTGQPEIWVKGYPDGVPVRISRSGGYEPTWSADGRELFYLQGSSMMAVAVETEGAFSFGAPAQLFNEPYFTVPNPGARSYDVARDGRFLMIEVDGGGRDAAGLSSIVVVENWTEELKQRVPTGN